MVYFVSHPPLDCDCTATGRLSPPAHAESSTDSRSRANEGRTAGKNTAISRKFVFYKEKKIEERQRCNNLMNLSLLYGWSSCVVIVLFNNCAI